MSNSKENFESKDSKKEGSQSYVLLDTETTGLSGNDEVIELGIIDTDGNTLYHSLFLPNCEIGAGATAVHGITVNDVIDAPRFADEWQKIKELLDNKEILIYNAKFDIRMLNQTAQIHGKNQLINPKKAHCLMLGYAKYNGEINPKTGSYKWIKLEQALKNEGVFTQQDHRVIGDCLMTLSLIRKVGKIIW